MRRSLLVLGTLCIAGIGVSAAKQSTTQEKPKDAQAESTEPKMTQEDIDRKNPVKPTPEGLAEARKMFTYDCAMCHGTHGDGKGDLVDSMKLTMHDWRDPATLAGKTDGEIFFIITEGKGKMVGEGKRQTETMRWNLVNLVRSIAAKETPAKPAAETPNP
jgi:cytochrome c5